MSAGTEEGKGTMLHLAENAADMPRSGIRVVMDLAWRTGSDVIGLHVGEPSFSTPAHIIEAAERAMEQGHTRYVPNAGITPLREALAEKVRSRNNLGGITTDDIVVTAGGMQGIWLALASVVRAGDEVLVPDPGWPNFRMAVQLLQARSVGYELSPDTGFVPDIEQLESAVTPRTRAIVINTPSNPLGAVLEAGTIEVLLEFAARHGLWVLSDECYDALTFDRPHVSPASLDPDGRVLSCFSFSKTYAMTGMRVGYVAVPGGHGAVLAKMQEALLACVNAPAQYAALAAVSGPDDQVEQMRATYRRRRDAACEMLDRRGVGHLRPEGAFYLWVDVRDKTNDVASWAQSAVTERRVAVAPGTAFGAGGEGFVRCSLATATDQLLIGLDRLLAD